MIVVQGVFSVLSLLVPGVLVPSAPVGTCVSAGGGMCGSSMVTYAVISSLAWSGSRTFL